MKPVDIAVVGAGAAGLMAAIAAARPPQLKDKPQILLLDTKSKIGAKILMSGGTRCNVTNKEVQPSDFQGGSSHFVKHILDAFTPHETLRFFKEIGVELVLEPTGKYFPATCSAQTVLGALMKEAKRLGIQLKTGIRMTQIKKSGDGFHLIGDRGPVTGDKPRVTSLSSPFQVTAQKVILTTGGLSYPTTGSDGTGYGIAKSFGHTVVDTFPALTPLLAGENPWKALTGISVEAELSFFKKGKKQGKCRGPLLFTHFGFSGPAALDISRHFAAAKKEERPEITASFLPQHHEASFHETLQSLQKENPNKRIKNILTGKFSLPERFVETLLKKINITGDEPIGKFPKESRHRMVRSLLHYPLEVTGVFGYKKAEVTAGGVDLKEVKVSTMESKLVDGLYFAGEILDVDGRIGGFNFQWAWSTGAAAGRSAAESLL